MWAGGLCGVDPRPFTMRELTLMSKGATFIWTQFANSTGGGAAAEKQAPSITDRVARAGL